MFVLPEPLHSPKPSLFPSETVVIWGRHIGQDFLTGAFLLTQRDVYLSRDKFCQYLVRQGFQLGRAHGANPFWIHPNILVSTTDQ